MEQAINTVWLLFHTFTTFKQALTQDVLFLIDSVRDSEIVQISDDKCYIRAAVNPTEWPLENPATSALTKPTFNPDVPEFVPSKFANPTTNQSSGKPAKNTLPNRPQIDLSCIMCVCITSDAFSFHS